MKKLLIGLTLALALAVGGWLVVAPEHQPTKLEMMARKNGDGGPKPDRPGDAAAWMAQRLETPNDINPALLNAQARADYQQRDSGATTRPNFSFQDYGPGNFGGRTRSIVVDPNNADSLLVGGVSGGVFKTDNGGLTWRAIDDFMGNLAVGSMVADPDDDDRVFLGTGEGFFNFGLARGLGIYRSNDFGETWTPLASTLNNDFYYVNRLGRIPGTDVLLAATRTGIWRSTDLGLTWNEVAGVTTSSRGFVDLKVDPSNTDRIYAFHYGSGGNRFLMRSLNGGLSFTALGAAEGFPTTDISRAELAVGTDGVVYASVSNNANTTRGLWRSDNGGDTFLKTASNTAYIERQGWYDLMIGVDPTNSDRIYLGAVDVFRSTDAGATISQVSIWNPQAGNIPGKVHADIHTMTFHPTDPNTFWVGCDGGVYKTTNGGDSFFTLNTNLKLSQVYGMAVHPDGDRVISGTQDNGSHMMVGDRTNWFGWAGGDGGYCAWDQQDPNFIYGSTPNGGLFGSSDGGQSTTGIPIPNTGGVLFIQPFTIDPSNGNRMILGTDNVYFTANLRDLGGATWVDTSGTLGTLTATTIDPHDGNRAYVGTNGGAVFKSTSVSTPSSFTQLGGGLPTGSDVTWVEVDPHDVSGNTVYVTFADYNASSIYKSTDGGASWTSIAGDLPEIPMFCVRVDPTDPDRLFLGSELGLWTTDDNTTEGSFVWEHYDQGPAWTRIIQLAFGDDDTLWMTTHGRGTFRGIRQSFEVSIAEVEDSQCDADGFLDEGETADLPVSVTNRGGLAENNVMVGLSSAYAGLSVNTPTQNFGTIAPGQTVTMNFELTLDNLVNCLDVAEVDVSVSGSLGTPVFAQELTLGVDPVMGTTFTEDAESMDHMMNSYAYIDTNDWARVTTQAHTGSSSWFAADIDHPADKSLESPWLQVGAGSTALNFWLFYDLEMDTQVWDGAVLELRTRDQDWFDIGHLSTVPYEGPLYDSGTTLRERMAWSGVQTTWREATVDLGSDYNGQEVQFRFRVVCDSAATNVGFWVDDISMTNVSFVAQKNCDTEVCLLCFPNIGEAITAMLNSAEDNWPGVDTVLDYVENLNNVCP